MTRRRRLDNTNRQRSASLQSAGLGVVAVKDPSSSTPIVDVSVPKATVDKIGAPFISVSMPANT